MENTTFVKAAEIQRRKVYLSSKSKYVPPRRNYSPNTYFHVKIEDVPTIPNMCSSSIPLGTHNGAEIFRIN